MTITENRRSAMNIDDFIMLPASEAGWLYQHHRDMGEADEASRLHQAYFEAHRVKLSDDRQIAEAKLNRAGAAAASAGRVEPIQKAERSKVRVAGALLSGFGLAIGLFAAAAGVGPIGLIISGCMASSGFMLWLVGVVEDRLIQVQEAVTSLGGGLRTTGT